MPKTKAKPAANPEAKKTELPGWVTKTRDELSYILLITDERGDSVYDALENISMSRDEYIALKRHLAGLRGYAVPAEATNAN